MSRDIDYVVFSVVPTLEDDNETKNSIENLKNDFANYDDYQTIVREILITLVQYLVFKMKMH